MAFLFEFRKHIQECHPNPN